MILQFSVENFLSFKHRVTLDFQAATIKEKPDNLFSPFLVEGPHVLKSLGLFGKNSSGKSNMLKAFSFFRNLIINSSKESQANEKIPVTPFKLSTESQNKPSYFEVIFFLEDIKYRYGFIVTDDAVQSEWLFYTLKRKESFLFIRAKKEFQYDKKFRTELKGRQEVLEEITRANSLYLSVLAQFNNDLGIAINKWFRDILIAQDVDHDALIDFSARLMTDVYYNSRINEVIQKSDLGIESVQQRVKDIAAKKNLNIDFALSLLSDEKKEYTVRTQHMIYDDNLKPHQRIMFDLLEQESLGTQKYFGLFGPILLALTQKKILWVDELDARLHPLLLENIIAFFNSRKYNPNGAQLIFTCHSTLPLKRLLRRDQMIFTDKDMYGVSSVESLYIKDPKVRNDASFDKDYLLGKYGAIPRINSQLTLFDISGHADVT